MMQIDSAIASHLADLKTSSRKSRKETQAQIMHFKLRVLDLLEIFVKRHSSSPLALLVPMPLLTCMQATFGNPDLAPLFSRCYAVLTKT